MRCSKCGARVGDTEVFCPECGIRVRVVAAEPPGRSNAALEGQGTERAGEPEKEPETVGSAPTAPPEPTTRELPVRRNSGWAVVSLILGIGGFIFIPIVGAVLAIIFGGIAKREIRKSGGQVKGSGMATVGITLGIIGIILPVIAALVLMPIWFVFWNPGGAAQDNLDTGVRAARVYYFENGDSYKGLNVNRLRDIDDTVDYRMAPGDEPEVVYIDNVGEKSVRLYCFCRGGKKYVAAARGNEWRYGFDSERGWDRWWRRWKRWDPLD